MMTKFEKFLLMMLVVLPILAMFSAYFYGMCHYEQLLNDAGINIKRHYVEVDGVRSNWVEIVYLNKKGEVR